MNLVFSLSPLPGRTEVSSLSLSQCSAIHFSEDAAWIKALLWRFFNTTECVGWLLRAAPQLEVVY
jgi:hypothetical protein